MSGPWVTVETYRCRACGAELFLTREDMAEHLIGCEKADPTMRRLAQEWLDAGAPRMTTKRRSRRQQGGSDDAI